MFDDPYVGMPIKLGNMHGFSDRCFDDNHMESDMNFDEIALGRLPLAMSYVPFQNWGKTYPLAKALERGTIFPDLDLPFKGGMKR